MGSIVMHSTIPLEPYPYRLTERLKHWARGTPKKIFIGRKNTTGQWETLTYAETFAKVQRIAHALLNKKVSVERPLAILSETALNMDWLPWQLCMLASPIQPSRPHILYGPKITSGLNILSTCFNRV
jgi:feruloyl-CoA synthase